MATGVHLAFGILFKPILLELGARRSALALAATAALAVNALGQPLLGRVVDHAGPRAVILPALAVMATGTALVSLATRPWHVVAAYGLVAAVGYTGAGILPVSVYVGRWFPGEGGLAMSLAATGFSLGHLVFAQAAAHLALAVGWRAAYLVLAAALLVALPGAIAWLRDPPAASQPAGASGAAPLGPGARDRVRGVGVPPLRTRAFWGLTLGLVGCGFTDFLLTTHLAPFATDLGLSPAVAANAVSLWAAANVAGTLLAGAAAERVGARCALVGTYLVRAASLLLLARVHGEADLYLAAGLFGATFFTTAPLSGTLVGQLFGPARRGALFGTVNLFHHLAGALGAWVGGLAFDLVGSYRPLFVASALLVVGSAAATRLARPPAPPAASAA